MVRKHNTPIDVLFINPPPPDGFVYIRDINRHGRSSWERMIWPQTNLAYLAAVAEQLGLSVDIIDCVAENIKWPVFEDILRICQPRYCFSNVISVTYSNDVKALRRSKEISHAITIGMGPHLTDSPKRSLQESEGLDFVICHEAEETLKELLEVLEGHRPPSIGRLSKIKGMAFIPDRLILGASKEPKLTEQRPFINDLDSLPRPRHDLLPLDRYWAPLLGHYTFVEASRGCSYRCIFCRQAVMWQWKYRGRRGKTIAEEALYVHSLGVENILFHADTFTLDKNLVEELCDTLIAAGSPFRWACNTHVKSLYRKPELVSKMKKAGCWMIAIGIESGDDQILKNIKKQITAEQAESVVAMIDTIGIEAWGYFILGLPGDTPQTLDKTVNFALSLPLKIAKFDIGAPYPGTEFYLWAEDHNYLEFEKYEDFDQNASAIVEFPKLSRKQIKAAVRRANKRFYLRLRIILYLFHKELSFTLLKTFILIIRDQILMLKDKRHNKS
ncbi:MAG: radical SAM protein [Bacteroidetes bacterium]|nr:radical SAM protein [Bacteroidota bacterium]